VLATIIFKGAAAGSSLVHISLVELADDTWPDPQPIPASSQDGQMTAAALPNIYLPLVVRNF
jgi:hypothetical protein